MKNKAFFFADFEGFDQTRGQTAISTIADRGAAPGHPGVDVRNPLTGEVYPAGTPIPMTAFARKVLNDLPAPTNAAAREQLSDPAGVHQRTPTRPAARSTSRSARARRCSAAIGWRDVDIFDKPPISADRRAAPATRRPT